VRVGAVKVPRSESDEEEGEEEEEFFSHIK
jgi:hypothetical protein